LAGWYSYRASRAGVNSIAKTFDFHLKNSSREKAIAVVLHLGIMKTALSKEYLGVVKEEKLFTPKFAAERLVGVVRGLGLEKGKGRCWDLRREEILPY